MGWLTHFADTRARVAAVPARAAGFGQRHSDAFWSGDPIGGLGWGMSASGVPVNADVALTLSPFWKGVRLISENFAAMQCHVHERLANGGHRVAPRHPVDYVVARRTFTGVTAFEHWETTLAHLVLRGNHFSRIIPGPRGPVSGLRMIHPDRVRVTRVPSGEKAYIVSRANDQPEVLSDADIFHVLGLSFDNTTGVSVITYALNSIGGMLAAEAFAQRFYKSGSTVALAAVHPGELGPEALDNLRKSITAYIGGLENYFGVLTLDEGIQLQKLGITAEDAQLLGARQYSVEEVARWLNLPPGVLGDSKTPTFASSKQFREDLIDLSFRPWAERIEARIDVELLVENDEAGEMRFFSKFNMDAILRGDANTRSQIHERDVRTGIETRNEARLMEDREPLPGLDEPVLALNMGTSAPKPSGGQEALATLETTTGFDARAYEIARNQAEILVRKELAAATKAATRFASDGEAWQSWLREFYAQHTGEVARRLALSPATAQVYTARQGQRLSTQGIAAASEWERTVVTELTALALAGDAGVYTMTEEQTS